MNAATKNVRVVVFIDGAQVGDAAVLVMAEQAEEVAQAALVQVTDCEHALRECACGALAFEESDKCSSCLLHARLEEQRGEVPADAQRAPAPAHPATPPAAQGASITAQVDFEEGLVPGAEVEVRWTNSHRYYRAIASVVRLNGKCVRVTVTRAHPASPAGAHLVGRTLSFPRLLAAKWSSNNGVFAL